MDYLKVVLTYLLFAVNRVLVLDNGLALSPPMGWMSWGYYMCGVDCVKEPEKCLNETVILSVADTFFAEGYQEAGYEYIVIDDCWLEPYRDDYGKLVADKKRFPNGMRYIGDYLHKKGLKFGMYTNIGSTTCMRYPGSLGHFKEDADTFASWGVDYLKVDGCFVDEDFLNIAYIDLGKRLKETGRPMVYSCSWPYYIEFIVKKQPNLTAVAQTCNLWRNYHDVFPFWSSVRAIILYFEKMYPVLQAHHRPGQWNDPDMLIFGTNTLTLGQSRVQLSVYAMLSAPLLLSCNMRRITPEEKQMLLNLDLLAVAQDLKGIMARPYALRNSITLWVKPHLPMKGDRYPSYSFLWVNLWVSKAAVSFTPSKYGLNCTDGYSVMDVFARNFINNVTLYDQITFEVPPEDAVMYTLYPL